MARKRKLSADRDAADVPFETVEETEVEETEVEETTDRAVHPPFETVGGDSLGDRLDDDRAHGTLTPTTRV
jgi:hypothetical protein